MKIGKKTINDDNPVYIIAEAGINHNGDLNIANQMIEVAAECGVDAIKFQSFEPQELFSKDSSKEIFEYVKTLQITENQHIKLKTKSEKLGLDFLSTPSGKNSLRILEKLKVKAIKIASPDISDIELLTMSADTKIPLIVSTGMSSISEIVTAVEILKNTNTNFSILHCNSSYPTPIKDVNLNTITYFKKIFDVPIGFSDHTLGLDACLTAVSMGAKIIEKHFTLDKNMDGPDQKLSSNPIELKLLVTKIREIEKLQGQVRSNVTNSEKKFRKLMRKSLVINKDAKSGTKITKKMLICIRPGTGISPNRINQIIGMTLKKDIKKGTILSNQFF